MLLTNVWAKSEYNAELLWSSCDKESEALKTTERKFWVWVTRQGDEQLYEGWAKEWRQSESEVVNELQQQIQEKTAEINRLTGENYQKDREIQKKDVQIGIYDSFLQSIGKKQEFDELEQQQKQQIHRGRH